MNSSRAVCFRHSASPRSSIPKSSSLSSCLPENHSARGRHQLKSTPRCSSLHKNDLRGVSGLLLPLQQRQDARRAHARGHHQQITPTSNVLAHEIAEFQQESLHSNVLVHKITEIQQESLRSNVLVHKIVESQQEPLPTSLWVFLLVFCAAPRPDGFTFKGQKSPRRNTPRIAGL